MSFDDPIEYIIKIEKNVSQHFKDLVVSKLRQEGFDVRESVLRCPGCYNIQVAAKESTTTIDIADTDDYAQWKFYRKELYRWVYDFAKDEGNVLYAKINEDLPTFADLKYIPYTNTWDR